MAVWLFALCRLSHIFPKYADNAVDLVKQIHSAFVIKGVGVKWKMKEDLSGPYPGYGLGVADHFKGYVIYRLIDGGFSLLEQEISEMKELVEMTYRTLDINQHLGAGMMVWLSHLFQNEAWSKHLRKKSLKKLDKMWIDPPGYFCRSTHYGDTKFAFTNYGISLGLQSINMWPERVISINNYFENYKHGDEYDSKAITHVMGCVSNFPGKFIYSQLKNII